MKACFLILTTSSVGMIEVIKGVDVNIESQIIAIIAECDLHSPVFDDPSRFVSRIICVGEGSSSSKFFLKRYLQNYS